MQTNSLILAKTRQTNENKSADFSAFGNGFRCVQNQSLFAASKLHDDVLSVLVKAMDMFSHDNDTGELMEVPDRFLVVSLILI